MILKARRYHCLLGAAIVLAAPASAQDGLPPECVPLVGTFLTLKTDDPTEDPGEVGRSLVSLTAGGLAFMADSAQGGGGEFQPFSEAAGAWTCEGEEDGAIAFSATMLDFTFPTDALPGPQIGRVDIDGRYAPDADAFSGETTVSFFPLGADPFETSAATASTGYRFNGSKVEVGR